MLNIIKGKNVDKTPIWFMRQAGRYLPEYHTIFNKGKNFLDVCYNPELATEITLQPIKRFNLDAAIVFADILLVPDALGCNVEFIKNVGPIIKGMIDIENLDFNKSINHLNPIFQTIKNVKQELSSEKTIIGFAGAPWTVLAYIIEGQSSKTFEKSISFIYQNKKLFRELINIITEFTIIYLNKQIEAGADVVQLFDSWSGLLNEELFLEFVIEPTRIIKNRVKAPVIGFPKGCGVKYLQYAQITKVDGLSVDYTMPLEWIRDNLQPILSVQGNLDPLMLAYDLDSAKKYVSKIFNILDKKSFIFNLGHGINRNTPVDHVQEIINEIRKY